jgi:hypothetical protein
MQNGARMRIECDHSRRRAQCPRALDNSTHDQLVTKMQTVKHAEREHGRSLNLGVVSSVKETHQDLLACDSRRQRKAWGASPRI